MADEAWTHHEGVVNGVRLHWVEAGKGPLVVLLHGFPEFWYAWRNQIPALAEAGFRVVALDLRGYNLSEKPREVSAYGMATVAEDVAELIRHLGAERAHVAGHDWGGVVAWWLAMLHPERVERLVIFNAPHPRVFRRELKTLRQLRKSWYAFFFQLPRLPEAVFRRGGFAILDRVFLESPRRKGAYTARDVEKYREAVSRPGAITAMLNYYRAARRVPNPRTRRIDAPTLVIWGEKDPHLNVENTVGLEPHVPSVRVERIPDASHWVLADAPDRVNELMIAFLRE
ncbi:MAG TPA: alpha/beta hydrolase [Longimicrobium sp.]|nr:alpha/beta hydrolase [Longimicrobium sp.]